MGKPIEYYRKYNEMHREQINANSRARYAAKTGKTVITRPDVAKVRRGIYAEALEEITDPDVRQELNAMLDSMIAFFMHSGLKQYAAENQALEFLAACVWNGATAPRRMQAAGGD